MSRVLANPAAMNEVQPDDTSAAIAEMRADAEARVNALDVFKFFVKPERGEELAVFGLTRTNEEKYQSAIRII